MEYSHVTMTRDQADDFVCRLVKGHPYMKDAMYLNFQIMWEENGACGFYHIINIRNEASGKANKKYTASPIQWESEG